MNFEQLLKPKAAETIPGRTPQDKGPLDCGSKTKAECDRMKMELAGALQNKHKQAPPKGHSPQSMGTPDARFGHHFGSIPVQEPQKKAAQSAPKPAVSPKPLPPKAAVTPPKAQPPKSAPPVKALPPAPKTPAASSGTKKEKP